MRRARALAVLAAVVVTFTAGCVRHDGGTSAPRKSAQPSGYAEMQKKADAAESAAAAADSDAAGDADR